MGGQQSQPQLLGMRSQPQLLGTSGRVGDFGQVLGAMAATKVSFDTNTGAVLYDFTSPDGKVKTRDTVVPNDQQDLGQYIDFVNKNKKAGVFHNPGVYPVTATMMAFDTIGTQVGVESIGQQSSGGFAGAGQPIGGSGGDPAGAKVLPMVTAYQIKNPPVRAVVYTDKAGGSKFLYKNDPGNVVQLVPNGSRIAAGASQQGATVNQAGGPGMNECETFRKMMAMCGNPTQVSAAAPAPAPAPASMIAWAPAPAAVALGGESTYAVQGEMYPIQATGGGYPTWLIILIIAILTGVLIFVKNS